MTDTDEGHVYPRPFGNYMLKGFPSGLDWHAPAAIDSHLRREYRSMHVARHDGGTPPLLESFVEDLSRGVIDQQIAKGIVVQACPWSVVNDLLGVVENLRGMARHVRCLEYFQDPPRCREGTSYADWCEENGVTERHAYELRDGAILAVWLRVVRWGARERRA